MFCAAISTAGLSRVARHLLACVLLAVVAVPTPSIAQAPAQGDAEQVRFDVLEFVVEGNTVLTPTAIETAVMPHLGPGRTMTDVEAARAALEKAYQVAGFLTVFVDLPEQQIVDGVVRLQVLEGRVERLAVTGSRYFSQGYIRSKVGELATGQVPNFNEVQRQLALVNRTEERRVQPVLRPGKLPGTVEVELKVTDELPLSGRVELHNEHGADTRPLRLAASATYENLFQLDHAVTLNASVAPQDPKQAASLVMNYAVPLDSGHTVVAYLAGSNSNVETLGSTSVLGKGLTLGLRYVMPFAGTGGGYHSLSLGADFKDLDESLRFADSTVTSTPLRYLPLQLAFNGNWSGDGRQTQVGATLVAALRDVLKRSVDCPLADGSTALVDQFACKRRNGSGGFGALRLDIRHTEPLPWGSLALRLVAQAATDLLPGGEQLSLGGAETVRGYLEGESVGDHGVLGSVELRSPNLAARLFADNAAATWLRDFSAIVFSDVGRATVMDPLPGQQARVPLWGSGLGLRMQSRQGLQATFDLALPHKSTRLSESGKPRAHLRVGMRF
jgi:hemolysin activation/secretion protein